MRSTTSSSMSERGARVEIDEDANEDDVVDEDDVVEDYDVDVEDVVVDLTVDETSRRSRRGRG